MTQLEQTAIRNALDLIPHCPERAKALVALDQVRETCDRRTRIIQLVQEALSQLRLDMKYLIFDLEATRRERDELQHRLDSLEK